MNMPAADRDGAVLRHRLVVEEVVLDHAPLVAEAEHEAIQAVVAEEPHDVPEERPAAYLHHRLGAILRLLAHPRALPATKDHDVHGYLGREANWPAMSRGQKKPHGSLIKKAFRGRECILRQANV